MIPKRGEALVELGVTLAAILLVMAVVAHNVAGMSYSTLIPHIEWGHAVQAIRAQVAYHAADRSVHVVLAALALSLVGLVLTFVPRRAFRWLLLSR